MSDLALGSGQVHKSRFSLEALEESKGARAVIGLGVVAAILVIVFFIWEGFLGNLTSVAKLDSTLPLGSNAVEVGAAVEYNYVTVGKISSEGRAANGSVVARLSLYPSLMKQVPSNVQAQVEPVSIFGNQEVALIVPPGVKASPKPLAVGASIPPYAASPATSLQGSVTTIYDLLNAVKPADLMTALDAVATALKGEGTALGQSLVAGSSYLKTLDPHLATVAADVQLLSPVSNEINAATPNALTDLSNSAISAQTISSEATEVRNLLSEGATASTQLNSVLQQVKATLPELLNQSGPLLSDINRNPNEISETLNGLGQWAAAWASAESNGPYISITANLPLANVNDAVDAALGYGLPGSLAGALGPTHFNPPTYTSADCPNYGQGNAFCGGGSPAAQPVSAASTAGTGSAATGNSSVSAASTSGGAPTVVAGAGAQPVSPYAEAEQAAEAIATALNGGQPVPQPAVATILLLPLLASMSAGVAMSHKFRNTLIKLAVFTVVSVVITVSVIASLLDLKIGQPTKSYTAIFSNVVGLQPGDVVRIAGVEEGKVNSISLDKKDFAKTGVYNATVSFSVASNQHLTTTTFATIDFENLLGQRYLALLAGPAGGQPLRGGATIPVTQTQPGLDLTTVFTGFQPVLDALDPTQVNQLTGSIIAVFQGESGAISNLLSQTAALTANLSQRQTLIYNVVDNLTSLLTSVNTKDSQIGQLISGLDTLVTGLAGQKTEVGGAVTGLSSLTKNLSQTLSQSQPYIDHDISKLGSATNTLENNENGLNSVLLDLPGFLNAIDKVSSSGNYLDAYVCDLTIHTVSPSQPTGAPLSVKLSPTVPQSPPLAVPQGIVGDQSQHDQVCA